MISFQKAEDVDDELLVQYYADEWVRYKTGAAKLNRLFVYFNRHWVARQHDKKDVYQVYVVRGLFPPFDAC
jgi:cullin 1